LTEIQHLLYSSNFDKNQAFELQRSYLLYEKERLTMLLDTLERSVQDMKGSSTMTQAEKFKGFDFTKKIPTKKKRKNALEQRLSRKPRKKSTVYLMTASKNI